MPVFGVGDATRCFHAWALTADDKVAYSRPVVVVRSLATAADAVVTDPEEAIPVPLIRTGGVFDDFVDSMTGRPINPFTPADVVVAHDLRTLRLFLNGQPAGEAALATPTYKRTHSTPTIAFVAAAQPAESPATKRLTGELDQVEIIGTALTPEAVAALHEKGQWLAR